MSEPAFQAFFAWSSNVGCGVGSIVGGCECVGSGVGACECPDRTGVECGRFARTRATAARAPRRPIFSVKQCGCRGGCLFWPGARRFGTRTERCECPVTRTAWQAS